MSSPPSRKGSRCSPPPGRAATTSHTLRQRATWSGRSSPPCPSRTKAAICRLSRSMPASVSMGRKRSVSSGAAVPPSMAVSQTWKWRSTLSVIWARRSRSWSMAAFSRRKVSSKSSMSVGLSRYSATWLRMDMFRYLKSLYPLRITILTWGYSRLSRCISSTPSIPGIRMSDRTTSGLQSSIRSSTSWPLAHTAATS